MKNVSAKKILAAISVALMMCLAFGGCAPAAAGTEGGSGSTIQFVISIVLLVAVFYFFMIRPERKRKKQAEELRSSISVGDDIVTIGGMMGKVVSVSDEALVFETSEDRVRIEVKKWAISRKAK